MIRSIEFAGTDATPRANTLFDGVLNATITVDDPDTLKDFLNNEEETVLTLAEMLIDGLLPEQVQALRLVACHLALRAMQMERSYGDELFDRGVMQQASDIERAVRDEFHES